MNSLAGFIAGIPKAELHLHIEGTLEPELMITLGKRNGVSLPFPDAETARKAYQFNDLQSFLDIYYQATAVLITEEDFYDLTIAYLTKAASQHVRHAEIFFDPQSHTNRGIAFETVIRGIERAVVEANSSLHISTKLIMCILRHLSEKKDWRYLRRPLHGNNGLPALVLTLQNGAIRRKSSAPFLKKHTMKDFLRLPMPVKRAVPPL